MKSKTFLRFIFKNFIDKVRLARTFPVPDGASRLALITRLCVLWVVYVINVCTANDISNKKTKPACLIAQGHTGLQLQRYKPLLNLQDVFEIIGRWSIQNMRKPSLLQGWTNTWKHVEATAPQRLHCIGTTSNYVRSVTACLMSSKSSF